MKIMSLLLTLGIMIGGSLLPLQQDDRYEKARKFMVERHLKSRDITDGKVLEVMGTVKRHLFIDPKYRDYAYADHPLPIDEGQTISQPYIVALMT